MPVTPNYYISHQWLRELKRGGQRVIVGIYFRVPDNEVVVVGHYREHHQPFAADEAVGIIMRAENPEGYEVVIPRRIEANEIHRIRSVPQVVGWRYYPGAHSRKPCGCPVCQARGEIKSRRLRDQYETQ
jgi:hypothetical protein